MAKASKQQAKAEKYPYPTRFGSHKSMVVESTPEELKDLAEDEVICQDEFGRYKTQAKRLDNGQSDGFRFDSHRLKGPAWDVMKA